MSPSHVMLQRTPDIPRALSRTTLAHHAARVAVPAYDATALSPAVVHISVGVFHRAHQAVYLDDLAQRGERGWGVVGVGLHSRRMLQVLGAQDRLYTVVERGADHDAARVVGVMGRYLYAPDDPAAVVAALTDPRCRLVTLTITGDGYLSSGPGSVWSYLAAALDRRRRAGLAPFTVLSCDNVLDNGAQARQALVRCARGRDATLAAWIEEHVAFPASMVDRITPRTTPADAAWVAREFGVRDRWPVITEPFSQWVVEDSFTAGRPPLEEVGAQVVPDVRPWSLAKTRLLNASHFAVGCLGSLAGLRTMDEAVRDPVLGAYVERLMAEVEPLLPSVPGLDLASYRRMLLERFANPKLADQLSRLRRHGSTKVPRHLASSIAEARAEGRPHRLLTVAVAGWLLALRGVDEGGRVLTLDDPLADRLQELAVRAGGDLRPLLAEPGLFGPLAGDAAFAAELGDVLRVLEAQGVHATLHAVLSSDAPLTA